MKWLLSGTNIHDSSLFRNRMLQFLGRKCVCVVRLSSRLWPLYVVALWVMVMTQLIQIPVTEHYPTLQYSPTGKLPYNVVSILREDLVNQKGLSVDLKSIRASNGRIIAKVSKARTVQRVDEYINYVNEPHPRRQVYMKGHNEITNRTSEDKSKLKQFYDFLKTTTGQCKKLAQFGGDINCNGTGDEMNLDGNKLICMEPEFQVGSKKQEDCLILSFGIQLDTSFDESIFDLSCEVHMYDLQNYTKEYLMKEKYMHFHQVGLNIERFKTVNKKDNITYYFDTLNNIAFDLGITEKLINVLKMDIESYEWDVLRDLSSKPYIDVIGQIAVEVHSLVLKTLPTEERMKRINQWISTIEALEAKGFRRVAYFDNSQPKLRITDTDGTQFETAGEMLLLNYNWYNETFRKELRELGYNIATHVGQL